MPTIRKIIFFYIEETVAPSPPGSSSIITENGLALTTEDNKEFITE